MECVIDRWKAEYAYCDHGREFIQRPIFTPPGRPNAVKCRLCAPCLPPFIGELLKADCESCGGEGEVAALMPSGSDGALVPSQTDTAACPKCCGRGHQ
jgi:hypothetical protein